MTRIEIAVDLLKAMLGSKNMSAVVTPPEATNAASRAAEMATQLVEQLGCPISLPDVYNALNPEAQIKVSLAVLRGDREYVTQVVQQTMSREMYMDTRSMAAQRVAAEVFFAVEARFKAAGVIKDQ